eukprot:13976819-Ditylum_brightwellii.AAC.1
MSKRIGRDRGRERLQETMCYAICTIAQVKQCTWFNKSTLTTHKSTTTSKMQSPKVLALDYILGKTLLLHPTIKNNLIMLGTHHIKLEMKAHVKANQKKRLTDDDDFIPCSAQNEFQFKVSTEAEADQEFQDLLETKHDIIGDCKQRLTAQIVKCIDIELKLLHQQLLDDF